VSFGFIGDQIGAFWEVPRPKINFCNCGFGHFRLTRVEVLLGRPPLFYFTGFLVERSLGDIEESHNELEVNVLGFCGMNVFT
jgi:hypothetical protein